ncbi:hypothetical protein [Acidithiobacillus thiooxidans]|uniref:Uncharacterized protein n=1 Tax=Acidithiobacillus thiooxidans TaxID=930 RepID=A0A1C2JG93_ACITH|nr:hypothetical protein [Acidithiobacillus thiooxidans]OCX75663.1 hypothetical protein A6M23_01710 [Acidithiobacillus thiooxidans]OCX87214.1 hypothetical protein A6P08_03580 [Acidithiobacillus thiooxidans]
MTNVHPFPIGGKSAKPLRKKSHRTKSSDNAYGPALLLQDFDDIPVDVLDAIIQAGSLYLAQSGLEHTEDELASPCAQFLRTLHGMNALTEVANVLICEAQRYPEQTDQEAVDWLLQRTKATHKVMRKLDEMLPQDEFILASNSFGPDFMAEYATNAAMLLVSHFAEDLLAYYDENFIQTRKDRRKVMMIDSRDAYREVIQDCQIHIGAHGFLMKELASAQRALNKGMKEL